MLKSNLGVNEPARPAEHTDKIPDEPARPDEHTDTIFDEVITYDPTPVLQKYLRRPSDFLC